MSQKYNQEEEEEEEEQKQIYTNTSNRNNGSSQNIELGSAVRVEDDEDSYYSEEYGQAQNRYYDNTNQVTILNDPKQYINIKVVQFKGLFKNFTDPNYQSPTSGLFQNPNEGNLKCCINKKLTPWQQIALGCFMIFLVFYVFIVKMDHFCDRTTADYCMDYIVNNLIYWLIYGVVENSIIYFTIYLAIQRVIPRFFLVQLALVVYYIYFLHFPLEIKLTTVFFYGPAQAIGMIIIFFLFLFVISFVKCMKFLWRRARYVIGLMAALIIYSIFWYISKASGSCDGWEKGLTGEIDYSAPYCTIQQPTVCYPVIFDQWFNLSSGTCDPKTNDPKKLKKEVLSNYKLIDDNLDKKKLENILNNDKYDYLAWKNTVEMSKSERIFDVIQNNIIEQSTPFKSLKDAFDADHEVVIGTESYSFNINVKRDEELVKKRQKEQDERIKQGKQQAKSLAKNVVVIYIDTVSRAMAHRKLPKSMEFLRKFNGNEEYGEQQKQIYEFYRFHSLDKMTKDNALILHFDELYEDYLNDPVAYEKKYIDNPKFNLMKHYKEAGFIVGHAANTCTSSCLFRTQYQDMRKVFLEEPGDHELTMWDPSYINPQNYYDLNVGPNSNKRRCMYGNDTGAYVFEYGQQFLEAYEQDKKFLYMEFTDSHEMTSEVLQYLDDHLLNFLQTAQEKKFFDDDTVVFIMSDHGQHIIQTFYVVEKPVYPDDWEVAAQTPDKVYSNNIYQVERMLPIYQMMFSKNILEKNPGLSEILKKNEQIIFGYREVRQTLLALAYGFEDERFQKNVLNPLKEDADCRDLGMRPILQHEQFCICRPEF